MLARAWHPHIRAVAFYALLAIAFSWPLPLHLSTHLTGPVEGDAGVYVWNQWVFRHELVEHRSLPYFTGKIFSLTSRANLSLHNYTTFANLVALPLGGMLGVVATFNVVYLLMMVGSAYAVFLLARRVTGGLEAESTLAGALFAWSPVLVTRGNGHYSLVAAAPLAVFLLLLLRAHQRWRARDAILLGCVVAWAATSDVYYAVFCLLLAVAFAGAQMVRVRRTDCSALCATVERTLDILIVCMVGVVAALAIGRGWRITFLGGAISLRGLYTPMLVLTTLALLRVGVRYRASVPRLDPRAALRMARLAMLTGVACAVLLSPVLYALGVRLVEGRLPAPRVFWRSSPPGVDVAALLLPNPNHPLAPRAFQEWLGTRRHGYEENVASVPLVALAVIIFARRTGWRIPRLWGVIAVCFGLLALGPFLHVAGINTHVPGPWALLRYVPVIGLARTPARFTVVLILAVSVIFALAVRVLGERYPQHRLRMLAVIGLLLLAELLPAPRPLYAATIPHIYDRIAADPRPEARVLELPFGVRDGTMSAGNFTARSQFYQTYHGKPLIGGYLSRVSPRRVAELRKFPVLDALMTLSQGATVPPSRLPRLVARGPAFVERAYIGWVVIDRTRASDELVRIAVAVLRLEPVAREGALELYRPVL